MQVGRLVHAMEDILAEYSNNDISGLLKEAIDLSKTRNDIPPQTYAERAANIRSRAKEIVSNSRATLYSSDLWNYISKSNYARGLPGKIAAVLISGFPNNDKNTAISSNEIQLYQNLTGTIVGELSSAIQALKKFGVEAAVALEGLIGVDILIPRDAFADDALEYTRMLEAFIKLFTYFNQYVSGRSEHPRLQYASTSDPVFGVAVFPLAAWGALKLYKLLLEIAEKQINVIKLFKELKSSGVKVDQETPVEEQIKEMGRNQLSNTVTLALENIPSGASTERAMEIKIGINKTTPLIFKAISSGASLSISIESISNVGIVAGESQSEDDIKAHIAAVKLLEDNVKKARKDLSIELKDLLGSDVNSASSKS